MRTWAQGRTVLVTGAASGIGKAVAARFCAAGANAILVDRDPNIEAVAEELAGGQGSCVGRVADLRRPLEFAEVVDSTVRPEIGLHAVVHAAALSIGGTVLTLTEAEWHTVLDTDLTSAFHVARATIPRLARTGGSLVLVASQLGLVGAYGSVAYTAAKGGLVNLGRSLALDHAADGIRVNCLCPGPTATPFLERSFERTGSVEEARAAALARVPLGRFGSADEIANGAFFLCSDEASFITGTTLAVDGGYLAQ